MFSTTRPRRAPAQRDAVLGELRWSEDEDAWECVVAVEYELVRFLLGGDAEPCPALIAHAHDIVRTYDAFKRSVADLLTSSAAAVPEADEIRSLTLESICLPWPERPDDGMIYFTGPNDELRVWRCDYVTRRPCDLGFDS
jgi:hypothetical protein